jgi:hypothetical protein
MSRNERNFWANLLRNKVLSCVQNYGRYSIGISVVIKDDDAVLRLKDNILPSV